MTSFTPKHMWKLYEDDEDAQISAAVNALKEFDTKFFEAA